MILPSYTNKIALGTANFGMDYGVANASGQLTSDKAASILSKCREVGINTIDTATAYGSAEQVLGGLGCSDFNVITKIPRVEISGADEISRQLQLSIARLNLNRPLDAVLYHAGNETSNVDLRTVHELLSIQKERGLVSKIGFSLYGMGHLIASLGDCVPDIIQAPFNVFDQRLNEDRIGRTLANLGCEVHIRSIFLQGLLVDPASAPPSLARYQSRFDRFRTYCTEIGRSPVQVALMFALAQTWASSTIVGVDSADQLQSLVSCVDELPYEQLQRDLIQFRENDLSLIEPSRW